MTTECNQTTFEFHGLFQRKVKARFDGGTITSDAGVLLLREVGKRTGLLGGLADCFSDHRVPRLIEHTVRELLGQRIYGLCLGYEDLNDHDQLRTDPMLAVAVEKADPLGRNRRQAGDRGKALAGQCTLNLLELTGEQVACLEDPDTPQWACRVIKGALVYFVMPIDAIPDFIPFTGFADDLAVLVLAMALVVIHIKPEHRKMAEEKWESLWSKANPNL